MLTKNQARLSRKGPPHITHAEWVQVPFLRMTPPAPGYYRCLKPLIYSIVENSVHKAITQHNRII